MSSDQLPDPQLTFVFEARVDVAPPRRISQGIDEELWFYPITGGSVSGPRLVGTVIPGGGDWATTRGTVTELDARYLIEADDGHVIDIVNRGFHRATSAVMARIDAGEDVPEEEYYYRTSPVFRADADAQRWLTESVFVGLARSDGSQVCIRFFLLS